MTVQTPRKPDSTANPFLNALDTPAFSRSTMAASWDSTRFPQGVTLLPASPIRPQRQAKAKKNLFPIALGWIMVALLLSWPLLSHWKPQPAPKTKTVAGPTLPVQYTYISSKFGPRWGRMHQGIDFAAQAGSPIFATAPGKIIHSGWEAGYGNSVIIEHDSGIQTRYAHCAKLLVQTGTRVSQGDIIAKVGSTGHSTGPHLHFEVIINGKRKNPSWYYPLESAQHIAVNEP